MSSIKASKPTLFSVLQSAPGKTMSLLPEAFATASIAGLWLPRHWQSSSSRMLYCSYTCLRVIIILLIVVSQLMALMFLTKSVDDMAESCFLFLTAVNASIKGLNMLIRRRRIVELLEMFDDWKCVPRNDEELKLCSYFDKVTRYTALSCLWLGSLTTGFLCLGPFLVRGDDYVLSMRAWQPYEITSEFRYYVTQTHQIFALMTMFLWNTASDFVCPGFMIQICSRLRLMYHRLMRLPEDAELQRHLVKQSVQHHLHIFEMSGRLETVFTPVILSQYLQSVFVLCISVYQLTNNPSDFVQIVVITLYVGAMAVELLMYCWFGNEVTVTSQQFSEIICEVDWTKLDLSNRKALIIMILRSSLPIRITCGPLITLSNETYARILKLSYSVFNLLQQSH